jgi:apolipoprotein N-acyltransferase
MKVSALNDPASRLLRPLGAIASGLLLSSAFAPLAWQVAAWIAPIPLLAVARCSLPRESFKWGWVAGLAFWLTSIFWLTRVTVVGWVLLSALCAVFTGLFAAVCSWWFARFGVERFAANAGGMVAAALAWAGLEYARSVTASGFPWNPLGAGQYRNPILIQIASWGGVYAVSALMILVSTGVALTLLRYVDLRGRWSRRPHGELFIALAALAAALAFGLHEIRKDTRGGATLRVALIQTNIPQDEKWNVEKILLIYERLRTLTENALFTKPDLVVWPETALPDDLRSSEKSYELVYRLATNGVPILVGTMDTAWSDAGPRYYNSSFLVDGDGVIAQTYDKRHLVPFGEYVPFRRALPFMKAMTPIEESFSSGSTSTVFQLEEPAARFSALICFEDTVAQLARESVRNGARMLVNQTNDAWFDPSAASRQHMAQCVFRCVENRVPAIRSANTGVTCHIDRFGRVRDLLREEGADMRFSGFKAAEVTLAPDDLALTFYTRHGDVFGGSALACAIGLVAAMLRRGPPVPERNSL